MLPLASIVAFFLDIKRLCSLCLRIFVRYFVFHCTVTTKINYSYNHSDNLPLYVWPMVLAFMARYSRSYRCNLYGKVPSLSFNTVKYNKFVVLRTSLPLYLTTHRRVDQALCITFGSVSQVYLLFEAYCNSCVVYL